VENIITSCLESKNSSLLEHLLHHCDFVGKIIQAEKQFTLEADTNKVHDSPAPSPLHGSIVLLNWFILLYVLIQYLMKIKKYFGMNTYFNFLCLQIFLQATIPAEGKSAPRIGCIGHLTRIANKLVQLGNNNSVIQEHLQVCYYVSSKFCGMICECLNLVLIFDQFSFFSQ